VDTDRVEMDGPKVYQIAVRSMIDMLRKACDEAPIGVDRLRLIVPHQANQRIINAVRQRMKVPAEMVYSNIRKLGNTSSSTIPLCLAEILGTRDAGELIGMTAFGGGFTYAGGVIQVR
ncbi:MAG: 3-oxoacyl-ACP synthase III family protein, partial [Spirochaetota bacterium]